MPGTGGRKRSGSKDRQVKDMRHQKWLFQGGLCWWCKEPMLKEFGDRGEYASMEHLVEAAKGGTFHWDNIRIAHAKCNHSRSHPRTNTRPS